MTAKFLSRLARKFYFRESFTKKGMAKLLIKISIAELENGIERS
jgi:hypothetical protein